MTFSVVDRSRKLKFTPYSNRADAQKARDIIRLIPDKGIPIGTSVYVMKDGEEGLYRDDLSNYKVVTPAHIKEIEKENAAAGVVKEKRRPRSFAGGLNAAVKFPR